MSNASIEHIDKVLAYLNENGESETLQHFNINIETLHRYQRKRRFWETKTPKVLLFDIETAPMDVLVFGLYKQRIPYQNIMQPSFLLGWSSKWLFDSKVRHDILTPEEAIAKNDSRIVQSAWKELNSCDAVIIHNGKKFDIPYLTYRFIVLKMTPPSPYQIIDTLLAYRKLALFPSNRLDFLSHYMHRKGKIKTDIDLWKGCLRGEQSRLHEMSTYNQEDTCILEDAYLDIRPFITSHPNLGIYQESIEPSCPTCGSTNIEECGHYTTSVNRYLAFRCKDCGSICRSRQTDLPLKCKSGVMMPTAR